MASGYGLWMMAQKPAGVGISAGFTNPYSRLHFKPCLPGIEVESHLHKEKHISTIVYN